MTKCSASTRSYCGVRRASHSCSGDLGSFRRTTRTHYLGYRLLLKIVASDQTWSNGTSWLPGITTWPGFEDVPADHVLITFDDYEDLPGMIFYNIMGITDSIEDVMLAVAAGLAAAEIFIPETVALGGQAITQLAYSAGQLAGDVGTFVLGELEAEGGLAVAQGF